MLNKQLEATRDFLWLIYDYDDFKRGQVALQNSTNESTKKKTETWLCYAYLNSFPI